jgi:hypothetical protein
VKLGLRTTTTGGATWRTYWAMAPPLPLCFSEAHRSLHIRLLCSSVSDKIVTPCPYALRLRLRVRVPVLDSHIGQRLGTTMLPLTAMVY